MLGKIKNVLIGLFCFFMVSMVWMMAATDFKNDGTGMNKFLAFGLWALSVFFIIKGKAVIITIISTVGVIIFQGDIFFDGLASLGDDFWSAIVSIIVVGVICFKLMKSHDQEVEEINERKENARKSGQACCPWCGSVSIQYYPLGVPFEDYDEDGNIIIRRFNDHYHCNGCGRRW